MSDTPTRQVPSVHHRRFGDMTVTTLCDGYVDVPAELFQGAPAAEVEGILRDAFRPVRPRITVNCYLVRSGGRTILVEAGTGTSMGPTLGWLPDSLAAAGVRPEEIDTVLLTHMHPDHSNGLTDAAGRSAFPNAAILMHEDELAHWGSAERAAKAEGRQPVYFQTAQARIQACKGQIDTFRTGEVAPGIEAVAIPGHTPGHTAYRVGSGDQTLLIWGDIVHVPEIQIPRPDIATLMDTDPGQAVATRRKVLDQVATDRQLVAGMHIGFPGLAHVTRSGSGYAFVPEVWALEP